MYGEGLKWKHVEVEEMELVEDKEEEETALRIRWDVKGNGE